MKNKGIFLLIFVFANLALSSYAQQQQRNDRRRAEFEELRQKRVAFITKAMELNAEESKNFWPLFDELQQKKIELNQQLRRALGQFMGNERDRKKHTEFEYKEVINLLAQTKVKEAKLDEEYILKFAKVISYEKIFKYQQAEQQFARQLLEQRGRETPTLNNGRR